MSSPTPSQAGRLTVLTGPSGVGKGTLVKLLLERHPQIWLSVSATTRAPRQGEQEGRSYFFLSREGFEQRVAEERLAAGRPVLLEIELEGARQVRRSFPSGFQVFLEPPSFEELERRIRGRGTDSEEAIQKRLERARIELAAAPEFDARLVNGELETALTELERLMGLAG